MAKKFYLTKEKLEEIKKEYEGLLRLKQHKTQIDVPTVLHSEEVNPEYISFQEDLNLLRKRIAELEDVLQNMALIKNPPEEEQSKINLGATVLVEVDGRPDEFTIVGSLEANPAVGRISNESPVGKALLGKKVDDTVSISSPIEVSYKIKQIKYEIQ